MKSTYQLNPHSITYIISSYDAPQTIGEESIPDYQNVLRLANMALDELILNIRHGGKVPIGQPLKPIDSYTLANSSK